MGKEGSRNNRQGDHKWQKGNTMIIPYMYVGLYFSFIWQKCHGEEKARNFQDIFLVEGRKVNNFALGIAWFKK